MYHEKKYIIYSGMRYILTLSASLSSCFTIWDVEAGVDPVLTCDTFDIGSNNDFYFTVNYDELSPRFHGTELDGYMIYGFAAAGGVSGQAFEFWVDLYVNEDYLTGSIDCVLEGEGAVAPPPPPPGPTGPPTNPPPPAGECQCGLANGAAASGRIVNGVEVTKHEIPWQVGLSNGGSRPWCGGTLISDQWVLTAAHCTAGESASSLKVILKEHDHTVADGEMMVSLSQIVDYPTYDSSTTDRDYSLLKLQNPVSFGAELRPACLPKDASETYEGAMSLVSGWGTTSSGGSQPNILMKLDQLPVSETLQRKTDLNYYVTTKICHVFTGNFFILPCCN